MATTIVFALKNQGWFRVGFDDKYSMHFHGKVSTLPNNIYYILYSNIVIILLITTTFYHELVTI